jgi:hypothetical protein
VFLRSLGRLVCPATFATGGLPVLQAIWITREIFISRTSQLVLADAPSQLALRCSGPPDFCLRSSAHDSRRMVRRARTFDTLRLRNSRSGRTRTWLPQSSLSIAVLVPAMRDKPGPTDNRKTRFDLRHALDCDLFTVTDKIRLGGHFVRTAHPCGCCSRAPLLEHWVRQRSPQNLRPLSQAVP